MDPLFAQVQELFARRDSAEGFLAPAESASLDAMVQVLSSLPEDGRLSLEDSMAVLGGLHAAREVGRNHGEGGSGAWSFLFEPSGPAGGMLTLTHSTPFLIQLLFQLDREFLSHGLFCLLRSNQECSFDLECRGSQWILRKWLPDETRQEFPLAVPAGAIVAWQTQPAFDFLERLVPADGGSLAAWATAAGTALAAAQGVAQALSEEAPSEPDSMKPMAASLSPPPPEIVPEIHARPHASGALCGKCAAPLLPGAKFCHACRNPVTPQATSTARFCTSCGKPCVPDARFCVHCRHPLNQ